MKKALFISLLMAAAFQLKAQQVTFKPVYTPKTTYTDTRDMNVAMTMEAAGQPINMNMTMNTIATTETGSPDNTKAVPVKITNKSTDIKMTMNGQEMPSGAVPPVALVIYGKYSANNKLAIDSVSGQKTNDSLKTAMVKMVESIQNSIKFPDHPLKIGETFTMDSPFSMPMMSAGSGNNMTVKMTFKLTNITNNIAAFDIVENMDIDLTKPDAAQNTGMKMAIKGLGTGTVSYDIKKQCMLTMVNTVDVDFDMSISGQAVKGKGTVASKDNVTVVAN
jgi:hypothetical protein